MEAFDGLKIEIKIQSENKKVMNLKSNHCMYHRTNQTITHIEAFNGKRCSIYENWRNRRRRNNMARTCIGVWYFITLYKRNDLLIGNCLTGCSYQAQNQY